MSLEQVNAFYEVLISEPTIYEEYFNKCCSRGLLNSCHWDKTKIVKFAASLGYHFNEDELANVWFESEPSYAQNSLSLSTQNQLLGFTQA
ncbi:MULTISPECIES: Nif11-like leader peptide family natural product precursor [unclassified Anabaena]|uniref:Nif11-like leader peptide family natural product precursor n=1 Tax=unclassified Anabaena TaxID=2619674 RepID=UPI00082B0727|nr:MULTISPECIES: Nif11-like leader peptide family natural product precursor [unclassified Anabaena]